MELSDFIAVLALVISMATYYLRDAERGQVRFAAPKLNPDESDLDDTSRGPYFLLVNFSAFEVRIARIVAHTDTGFRHLITTLATDDIKMPIVIGARSSVKIFVDTSTFAGLSDRQFRVYAETETGKVFKLRPSDVGALEGYMAMYVKPQAGLQDELARQVLTDLQNDKS